MSLSTDLQAAISQLQTDHSDLVTTVRARNGVSGSTNTAIAGKLAGDVTIQAKADALRAAVALPNTESLSLDFINDLYQTGSSGGGGLTKGAKFSDLITFTRASVATKTNREGKVERVAANQPRFDYDPITGVLKGLLIEESRTNLITSSLSYLDWAVQGNKSAWAKNSGLAPDGNLTLNMYDFTSGTQTSWGQFAVTPGQVITFSQWVGLGTATTASYGIYDASAGQFIAQSSYDGLTQQLSRRAVTFTVPAGCTAIRVYPVRYIGTSNLGTVFTWGAQLEVGAFATSYIPTPQVFTSRAGTATYINANGAVQTAPTNTARADSFGYDAAGALKPIGLLVEGSATNLLLRSSELETVPWARNRVSVVKSSTLAPDGTDFYREISITDSSSTPSIFAANPALSTTAFTTFSAYVKAGTTNFCSLRIYDTSGAALATFDLAAGVVQSKAGPSIVSASIVPAGLGQWRISMTVDYGARSPTGLTAYLCVNFNGPAVGDSILAWGMQLEVGNYATSYIPTTTAQVTRAADVVTSTQAVRANEVAVINTLSPWFNQSQSTLFVDFTPGETGVGSVNSAIYMGSSNLSNDYVIVRRSNGSSILGMLGSSNGTNQAALTGLSNSPTGVNCRVAMAWKFNDSACSVNGGNAVLDNSVILPAPTRMLIGGASSQQFINGHMRQVRYYPRRLTDAELKAMTA